MTPRAGEIASWASRGCRPSSRRCGRARFWRWEQWRLLDSKLAPVAAVTVHPSSILRQQDEVARQQAREEFVADLRFVAGELAKIG